MCYIKTGQSDGLAGLTAESRTRFLRGMPIKKDLRAGGLFCRKKRARLARHHYVNRVLFFGQLWHRGGFNETEGREANWLQSFPAFSPLKTVDPVYLKRREKKPLFFPVIASGLCNNALSGTVSPILPILHSVPSSSQ